MSVPINVTTYRYAVFLQGVNYAPFDVTEPAHAIMVTSLEDVRSLLTSLSWGRAYGYETGEGKPLLDTPGYGEPGDGAWIFRVPVNDPEFSLVLDEPGDRARHAYIWMLDAATSYDGIIQDLSPAYVATFGARGGITIEEN